MEFRFRFFQSRVGQYLQELTSANAPNEGFGKAFDQHILPFLITRRQKKPKKLVLEFTRYFYNITVTLHHQKSSAWQSWYSSINASSSSNSKKKKKKTIPRRELVKRARKYSDRFTKEQVSLFVDHFCDVSETPTRETVQQLLDKTGGEGVGGANLSPNMIVLWFKVARDDKLANEAKRSFVPLGDSLQNDKRTQSFSHYRKGTFTSDALLSEDCSFDAEWETIASQIWGRCRWAEILNETAQCRKEGLTISEISVLKKYCGLYITEISGKPWRERPLFRKIASDLIEYLNTHPTDPSNVICGLGPTDYLMKCFRPLSDLGEEKSSDFSPRMTSSGFGMCDSSGRPHLVRGDTSLNSLELPGNLSQMHLKSASSTGSRVDLGASKSIGRNSSTSPTTIGRTSPTPNKVGQIIPCQFETEELSLWKMVDRWGAMANEQNCIPFIIDEIVSLRHIFHQNYALFPGTLLAIRLSSIPLPYRNWLTNEKWEKEYDLTTFILCRLAAPISFFDLDADVMVYLDPYETVPVPVPAKDVSYFDRSRFTLDDFEKEVSSFNALCFMDRTHLFFKSAIEKIEQEVVDSLERKGIEKKSSQQSKTGSLRDLRRMVSNVSILKKEPIFQSNSFSNGITSMMFEKFLSRFHDWLDALPPGHRIEPRLSVSCEEIEAFVDNLPNLIEREVANQIDNQNSRFKTLKDRLSKVLNGTRKNEVCSWWLSFIERRADSFLVDMGYFLEALPQHYTDTPPESLDQVRVNLKLVQSAMQGSDKLESFVDKTTTEVYQMLDQLMDDMLYVLEGDWAQFDLGVSPTDQEKEMVRRDLNYLIKMKEMDHEIQEKRKEMKKGLEMSEVVPVAGLVMARFHIYECECKTALDIWGPKDKQEDPVPSIVDEGKELDSPNGDSDSTSSGYEITACEPLPSSEQLSSTFVSASAGAGARGSKIIKSTTALDILGFIRENRDGSVNLNVSDDEADQTPSTDTSEEKSESVNVMGFLLGQTPTLEGKDLNDKAATTVPNKLASLPQNTSDYLLKISLLRRTEASLQCDLEQLEKEEIDFEEEEREFWKMREHSEKSPPKGARSFLHKIKKRKKRLSQANLAVRRPTEEAISPADTFSPRSPEAMATPKPPGLVEWKSSTGLLSNGAGGSGIVFSGTHSFVSTGSLIQGASFDSSGRSNLERSLQERTLLLLDDEKPKKGGGKVDKHEKSEKHGKRRKGGHKQPKSPVSDTDHSPREQEAAASFPTSAPATSSQASPPAVSSPASAPATSSQASAPSLRFRAKQRPSKLLHNRSKSPSEYGNTTDNAIEDEVAPLNRSIAPLSTEYRRRSSKNALRPLALTNVPSKGIELGSPTPVHRGSSPTPPRTSSPRGWENRAASPQRGRLTVGHPNKEPIDRRLIFGSQPEVQTEAVPIPSSPPINIPKHPQITRSHSPVCSLSPRSSPPQTQYSNSRGSRSPTQLSGSGSHGRSPAHLHLSESGSRGRSPTQLSGSSSHGRSPTISSRSSPLYFSGSPPSPTAGYSSPFFPPRMREDSGRGDLIKLSHHLEDETGSPTPKNLKKTESKKKDPTISSFRQRSMVKD